MEALPDCPPQVGRLLEELLAALQGALGEAIEAVYLFGSLAAGDFDADVSDLDLLAVVRADVDDAQLERLGRMHEDFARAHPAWDDRIEVLYIFSAALRSFKERESPIVVISPGEPLHRIETSPGWLMNWHGVRERGVTLFGPPPRTVIAETTEQEFADAVRGHVLEMSARAEASQHAGFLAYTVLTACRGLRTCLEGGQPSKREGAEWAARRYPEWVDVIHHASTQRKERRTKMAEAPRKRAIGFVRFAARQLGGPG